MQEKINKISQTLENWAFTRILRSGLIMIVPVLMIGSFALIGMNLPIKIYLQFIDSLGGGVIVRFLNVLYASSFGLLSVYMTAAIAISYQRYYGRNALSGVNVMIVSLVCFFVMSGVDQNNFDVSIIGPKGMAVGILSGYLSSMIFFYLKRRTKVRKRVYSAGDNVQFNNAITAIVPSFLTISCFVIFDMVMAALFGVNTIQELIALAMQHLFLSMHNEFTTGLAFVVLSSILWFFGIHGSDCLELVMDSLFSPGIQVNANLVAQGLKPTVILTKQFFDSFVLMGGCGSAICLLIALWIFGRQKSHRRLSKLATLPMLFNINEMMIFGLPVIMNPVLLIPFLFTPIVCYIISYTALKIGFVPLTISPVDWTTPVLMNSYVATGSFRAVYLQLIEIIIGVSIYSPFIRKLDNRKSLEAQEHYHLLLDFFKKIEENNSGILLTNMDHGLSEIAKNLAVDLEEAIKTDEIQIFYQPQYQLSGKCIGAEGLLRYCHEDFGMIYPPLVVKLANEMGLRTELEKHMISLAVSDSQELMDRIGNEIKLSVNLTGETLSSVGFVDFIKELSIPTGVTLCLEITEQTALNLNNQIHTVIDEIKGKGIVFAIDDFSMGQTSINYLKDKIFDYVKLDGSLVRDILINPRCLEIISSIVELSKKLDFIVIAEYVETVEERDALAKIGCVNYQGYLYSKAVELKEIGKNK